MFRPKFFLIGIFALGIFVAPMRAQPDQNLPEVRAKNALATALWFAHRHAAPQALTPGKDQQLKAALIAGLANKSRALSWHAVKDVFDKSTFDKLGGAGNAINLEAMDQMLHDTTPLSRKALFAKVREHADLLSTQFDLIDEPHRDAAGRLVAWIEKNYRPGETLPIIVICTGNSRRSILGSTMGNIAAAYYGVPNIRFYSGGTTPSAFNRRTIATLKEIGVEIEATGKEAPRGSADEKNPIYKARYGAGQDSLEFSKVYSDPHNPQKGFAAVLVCGEADAACPRVSGANARIPTPYDDPKLYDDAPFESAKYAERRDDIGRFMLSVLMQARRRMDAAAAAATDQSR